MSCQSSCQSFLCFFSVRVKAASRTLMKLTPVVNFINAFWACFSYKSAFCCQNVTREKLREAFSYEKCVPKMLMKLTPGVNFTNILHKAFTSADPKGTKIQSSHQSFLHFWNLRVYKLVLKTLVKFGGHLLKWPFYSSSFFSIIITSSITIIIQFTIKLGIYDHRYKKLKITAKTNKTGQLKAKFFWVIGYKHVCYN